MSIINIQPTYPIFTDIDGQPLENGYVWIGTLNLDPQTNPIVVYWDAALTIPAAQPIRTIGGYLSNNGSPANIYAAQEYSIRVMNKNGSVIYSAANGAINTVFFSAIGESLSTAASASAARSVLGLVIGTDVQAYDVNLRPSILGTGVVTTSGTAIDFTGIPNWIKRVTVMFNGVSASGTSKVVVRIGDSGGVVSTAYLSGVAGNGTASNETSGFAISSDQANAYVLYGSVTLMNIAGTTWISSGVIGRSDGANAYVSGGGRTLTGTLDRVRITTVNGTDTFDAGYINIIYE